MSHSEMLKDKNNEVGMSRYIPITHLNAPHIFEASNGMIGVTIHVEGVTFDTATDQSLNQYRFALLRAIHALDERFCVYETLNRKRKDLSLKGKFPSNFEQELNDAYHARFEGKDLYANEIYLTFIYKGITSGKMGKGLSIFRRLQNKTMKDSRERLRREQIKILEGTVNQLLASLSAFRPRILGKQDETLGYSELLSFLSSIVNGGEGLQLKQPQLTTSFGKQFSETLAEYQRYPLGNIAGYLSSKQILFGDMIQLQGAASRDTRFAVMLSIKAYGAQTASIMLDPLLHLNCEFIRTNSFFIEGNDVVLGRIKKHAIKMQNSNDAAISQFEALTDVQDMLASGRLSMGYHHNTLMLIANSKEALEKAITQAVKAYANAGFVAVRETLGQEAAFWAQIPTNQKAIARSSLITSENFVDFCPLHNYRTGYCDANHLGSAVTLLETPSKTPYFFNYHAKGSRNNPSKGHTIITGGNDSGKTAMMTFMDAQMSRYGGNTYYFDRDQGAEIYIKACGGTYALLSPEQPEQTCFNPFALPDNPKNRGFCKDLLIQLCKKEVTDTLSAEDIQRLKECVDYAYDKLSPDHRTLSHATKLLPMNFSAWHNLRRWLRGNANFPDGEYAYIFDNEKDQLTLATKMGFDMTHFLNDKVETTRTAVLMYLFHRIAISLKGQRVSIILDEGWQYLKDQYWESALSEWLPTFRKYNAHIVIATQSPSSIVESPIRAMILDNVATQIYFANPMAEASIYCKGLKLTESEFDIIKNNDPSSRQFLVKQAHDSTLCKLNLGNLEKPLAILSGNTKNVELSREIISEVGEAPEDWMPVFHKRRLGMQG